MSYQIRSLSKDDKQARSVLWTGYLNSYQSQVSPEVVDTTFSRLVNPEHTNQQAFVAEGDGGLLGLVHLIYHPHNWYIKDVCYLQDLYTAPDARGKGVATALIKAVYRDADANDAPSVYWNTLESNHVARSLYDKQGELTSFIKYRR